MDEGNAFRHDKSQTRLTEQLAPAATIHCTHHPCSTMNKLYSAALVFDHAMAQLSNMLPFYGELS